MANQITFQAWSGSFTCGHNHRTTKAAARCWPFAKEIVKFIDGNECQTWTVKEIEDATQ